MSKGEMVGTAVGHLSSNESTQCPHGAEHPMLCMNKECYTSTSTSTFDEVNKAEHYNMGGDTYEVVKVLEAWGLTNNAYLWNVVKYVARANHKGTPLKDLKKSRYYLDREIKRMEGELDEQPDVCNHGATQQERKERTGSSRPQDGQG